MDMIMPALIDSESILALKPILRDFSSYATKEDYILLPLVLIASTFIYNKGSLFPRRDPYAYKLFERPQDLLGARTTSRSRTRNVAEAIAATNADLVIFWGSQSGVAEGFAQSLAHEFTRRFKKTALVADLSDYDPQIVTLIPHIKLALFIMSTYGEGEPSDNAVDFVSWAQSEGKGTLDNLKYAAFGCGNRNYKHYNKTVDDVVSGLTDRGATAVTTVGKGDESTRTTNEDFLEWKSKLFTVLVSDFNFIEYDAEYESRVDVIEEGSRSKDVSCQAHVPFVRGTPRQGISKIIAAPIATQRVIATYKESDRTCVHLELDIAGHREIKYKTGDHVCIWPVNPVEEISSLLQILGLEGKKDNQIRVVPRNGVDDVSVPSPTTPHTLFQHYLEICAPIRRENVLFLADFAPTKRAKAELKNLAETKETYAQFLQSNHVTLSRLLKYITNIDPSATWEELPLSFIIDILPPMKPRTYSISSSPAVSPRKVSITVSTNPTRLTATPAVAIPGLASTFLSSLPTPALEQDTDDNRMLASLRAVYAQVRTSTFRLPVSLSVPIIMVAAGTGVAPFRAFLQERAHLASLGKDVGPMLLFFGCQDIPDFLYQDLLEQLKSGPLAGKLQVFTAFSRAEGAEKQYVGDQIAAHIQEVGRFLTQDGAFYICGAAAMAKSVKSVLKEELGCLRDRSDAEADDWVQEKKKAGRWFEDVWS